jgi:hypothetical protein
LITELLNNADAIIIKKLGIITLFNRSMIGSIISSFSLLVNALFVIFLYLKTSSALLDAIGKSTEYELNRSPDNIKELTTDRLK